MTYKRIITKLLTLCIFIFAAGPIFGDILLSGGIMIDAGSHEEQVYTGPSGSQVRQDETVTITNVGLFGGLDLGFEPGSFGVHTASGLTFLGGAKSELKGSLGWTELFLTTQLKYNTPLLPTAKWSKKPNKILYGLNPWIGLGVVTNRAFSKTVKSTDEDYEPKLDLMDFGVAVTIGFNMNFWRHLAKSGNWQKKMMGITYLVFDVTYMKSLTPDDENISIDNGGIVSRSDFIIRIGSALRISTSDKKKKKTTELKL